MEVVRRSNDNEELPPSAVRAIVVATFGWCLFFMALLGCWKEANYAESLRSRLYQQPLSPGLVRVEVLGEWRVRTDDGSWMWNFLWETEDKQRFVTDIYKGGVGDSFTINESILGPTYVAPPKKTENLIELEQKEVKK